MDVDRSNHGLGGTVQHVADSSRRLGSESHADACFFRSRAKPGHRKALIQITERCDLKCAHCFVSATSVGDDMEYGDLVRVVGRLKEARVANVTLTGGEPFVHEQLLDIARLLVEEDMDVTICTNGVAVSQADIDALKDMRRISVNLSLDGFSAESHGRFRGDPASFDVTIENARRFGAAGLLKGILSTPNAFTNAEEYERLYEFATKAGVEYVLMNPLSSFGRGFYSQRRLKADEQAMRDIQGELTRVRGESDPETVFIRFPNSSKPLTGCIAGEVFYVFVNGDVAICPYLVFAARNRGSVHDPEEFIAGNLLLDADIAQRLDEDDFHERYSPGSNPTCRSCDMRSECGCGCPAAVIAKGRSLGDLDAEVCPISAAAQ